MKSNKKFLQFIAALLILIFHLWMPVTNQDAELFIVRTGYSGVDIFFFLSAFSLAGREIIYWDFIKKRFLKIYGKYLILVVIAGMYKKMTFIRIFKILFAVEFFQKGGGAFLWFIPAILIFYLIFPLFHKWQFKYKSLLVLVVWFIASLAVFKLTGYDKLFIFTNRIPVMLAGYELSKKKIPAWTGFAAIAAGLVLLYFFGFRYKLNQPFTDFYFVFALLIAVGIYRLSFFIKPAKFWEYAGSATLELYGLQMIFGAKIVTIFYKATGNSLVTNIVTIVIMFLAAFLMERCFRLFENKILKNKLIN